MAFAPSGSPSLALAAQMSRREKVANHRSADKARLQVLNSDTWLMLGR